MAPEIHNIVTDPEAQYDATKADTFALGVILFALVFGKLPFEFGNRSNKIYETIASKEYDKFWITHQNDINRLEDQESVMMEDLKELLQGVFQQSPSERMDIEQILEHPWMQGQTSKVKI